MTLTAGRNVPWTKPAPEDVWRNICLNMLTGKDPAACQVVRVMPDFTMGDPVAVRKEPHRSTGRKLKSVLVPLLKKNLVPQQFYFPRKGNENAEIHTLSVKSRQQNLHLQNFKKVSS